MGCRSRVRITCGLSSVTVERERQGMGRYLVGVGDHGRYQLGAPRCDAHSPPSLLSLRLSLLRNQLELLVQAPLYRTLRHTQQTRRESPVEPSYPFSSEDRDGRRVRRRIRSFEGRYGRGKGAKRVGEERGGSLGFRSEGRWSDGTWRRGGRSWWAGFELHDCFDDPYWVRSCRCHES